MRSRVYSFQFKLLVLSILSFSLFSSVSAEQKQLHGFQNIPWESSMGFVKSKFPQVKEIDWCKIFALGTNDLKKRQLEFKNKDSSCISLEQDNYPVAGFQFSLRFSFNSSNKIFI